MVTGERTPTRTHTGTVSRSIRYLDKLGAKVWILDMRVCSDKQRGTADQRLQRAQFEGIGVHPGNREAGVAAGAWAVSHTRFAEPWDRKTNKRVG